MPVGRKEGKPLLRMLTGGPIGPADAPPIWLMRQAGRYLPEYRALRAQSPSFLDFCFTPDLAVEATLQPIRRFGFDGAIMFSDILVIPHALGQAVRFAEGHGPLLEPVRSKADIARLSAAGLRDRLAPVFETLRRLSAELPAETTLIGFAGAPWTVASYMIEGAGGSDFVNAKRMAYGEPDALRRADRSAGGEHRRLPRWPRSRPVRRCCSSSTAGRARWRSPSGGAGRWSPWPASPGV